MKGRTIAVLGVGGGLALALLFLVFRPGAPAGLENGTFANDCCGELVLRDGAMLLNAKATVRYAVGRDARGPYILPRTYVGAFEDKGFEVDGSQAVKKLRLDRLPHPKRIILYEGATPHSFAAKDQVGRSAPGR
jgi:hypothetical protein